MLKKDSMLKAHISGWVIDNNSSCHKMAQLQKEAKKAIISSHDLIIWCPDKKYWLLKGLKLMVIACKTACCLLQKEILVLKDIFSCGLKKEYSNCNIKINNSFVEPRCNGSIKQFIEHRARFFDFCKSPWWHWKLANYPSNIFQLLPSPWVCPVFIKHFLGNSAFFTLHFYDFIPNNPMSQRSSFSYRKYLFNPHEWLIALASSLFLRRGGP